MKFERGKSTRDPIYLRKPTGEYWMEGDVYENLCGCLTQIFGQRNFFVDSFTPRFGFGDEKFYTVAVTDRDGDTHGFVAKVVNAEEFDRTQRGGRFREEVKEIDSVVEDTGKRPLESKDLTDTTGTPIDDDIGKIQTESMTKEADDSYLFNTIEKPDEVLNIDEEELKRIKEQLKQEREIEELNAEMKNEGLISETDSDIPPEDKQKKHRGRGRKKR